MSAVAFFGTLAGSGVTGPRKALQGGRSNDTWSPTEVDYGAIGQGGCYDGVGEAASSLLAVADGTLGYLGVYGITANAMNTPFRAFAHVANADTALEAVVPALSTANVVDSTHEVDVTAGDTITLRLAADAGGGTTIQPSLFALWFAPDTGAACHLSGGAISSSIAAGATEYMPVVGRSADAATTRAVEATSAGTLQTGRLNVASNATTGASTVTLKKNGSATSLAFSIGAGTTGVVTSTGSATVADGDTIEWEIVNGGGGTLILNQIHIGFVSSDDTTPVYWVSHAISIGASTEYCGLMGGGGDIATEDKAQVAHGFTGTSSGLRIEVTTLTGNVTCRFRKNTANGNQVVVAPNGGAGVYEDVTNEDSFDADDLCCYSVIRSSGSGTQTANWIATREEWVSG